MKSFSLFLENDHHELCSLVCAAIAERSDFTSSLVLSDWLEDHGKTTLGQLLRSSCKMASSQKPSSVALLNSHKTCYEELISKLNIQFMEQNHSFLSNKDETHYRINRGKTEKRDKYRFIGGRDVLGKWQLITNFPEDIAEAFILLHIRDIRWAVTCDQTNLKVKYKWRLGKLETLSNQIATVTDQLGYLDDEDFPHTIKNLQNILSNIIYEGTAIVGTRHPKNERSRTLQSLHDNLNNLANTLEGMRYDIGNVKGFDQVLQTTTALRDKL